MEILLRRTDDCSLIFFVFFFLYIIFIASILLLNHIFVGIFHLWLANFNVKLKISVDHANKKLFQFNFASLPFIVIGKFFTPRYYMYGSLYIYIYIYIYICICIYYIYIYIYIYVIFIFHSVFCWTLWKWFYWNAVKNWHHRVKVKSIYKRWPVGMTVSLKHVNVTIWSF